MGYNVLVIGSGGREHALAWKIRQSTQVSQVYVAPGNGGTANIAENVPIPFTDVTGLVRFASNHDIDLAVIGQEAASAAGVVDAFTNAGLPIFGPTKAATQIESSKVYSKNIMKEQGIPTAGFETFEDPISALTYIQQCSFPLVIKASGLAEGKGVVIAENIDQARQGIDNIMVKKIFKDSGNMVVVEDFLKGRELSIHALCDGKNAILFPVSQDHKQVLDSGKGPNTGGMGVVAPVPWFSAKQMRFVQEKVVKPTLRGLLQNHAPFTGCLYPGLMIEGDDIKVLEFNARFGDPEAQTYMRLLDSDFYQILESCTLGKLDPSSVVWKPGSAISIAVASGGYPGTYQKGLPISGIEEAEKIDDVVVFQAGTVRDKDGLKTAGGRVLYVTSTGSTIEKAREKAYEAIDYIHFESMHYRKDIGLYASK